MALFKWIEDYNLGITVIDLQHQKILDYINELHDAKVRGESMTEVQVVLQKLVEYAKFHFGLEEDFFERFNYKHANEHIALHMKYIDEISELINKFNENDPFVADEMINFLKGWLINHICKEDPKYKKCFIEHGIR